MEGLTYSFMRNMLYHPSEEKLKSKVQYNYLGIGQVIKIWDQEVCSLCGLRFESCGYSYDGHWRLTWSLTSGPVGLVEVHTS